MSPSAAACQDKHTAYLSLGSNIGDRIAFLSRAVEMINMSFFTDVEAVSPVYETEPWGYADQNSFLNLCLKVCTTLAPAELLDSLQAIENRLGRVRGHVRYGPRTIDIDMLLYDDVALSGERLTLPHPRMFERAFVLVPLSDICGDGRVKAALERVGRSGVVRYPAGLAGDV